MRVRALSPTTQPRDACLPPLALPSDPRPALFTAEHRLPAAQVDLQHRLLEAEIRFAELEQERARARALQASTSERSQSNFVWQVDV